MTRPLNLLFMFTDQQRPDTLGCYGNPLVPTPHLDALAAMIVRLRAWQKRTVETVNFEVRAPEAMP